jgi:ABC-type polysaccharide/polyol phosphate export permease
MNNIANIYTSLRDKKDIWWYLCCQDLNSQFRRSKLGSLWLVINQLSFAFGAGFIWATVFGLDPFEFIPFIATGFAVWGFISSCFVDGCAAFIVSQGFIKQVALPLPIYVMRVVAASFIRLLIGLAVAAIIVLGFTTIDSFAVLYVIPGVLLVGLSGFFIALNLAYLGAKYRDLQHGLANLFQLLFVLTPVIYPPELLIQKGLWFAVYFNPLSSFIQVIRVPLVDQAMASNLDYLVMFLVLFLSIVCSHFSRKKFENKIAYYI